MSTPPGAPPKLPPAMGDCISTLQPAAPGAAPLESAYKMIRAADGSIRVDSGQFSVLTDPSGQRNYLLDHVKKEVHLLSFTPPSKPAVPGLPHVPIPGLPAPPQVPQGTTEFQDLGKKILEGEEVVGRRLIIHPPALPNQPPPPPSIGELWTNASLHLPVLTQVQGPFGQQICKCKNVAIPEPNPSLFQIPPDYTQVQPPRLPAIPAGGSVTNLQREHTGHSAVRESHK